MAWRFYPTQLIRNLESGHHRYESIVGFVEDSNRRR